MELIFIFLGSIITLITIKRIIEASLFDKVYVKKCVKVIGFENAFYFEKEDELSLNRDFLYTILEVKEKDGKINLVLPVYEKMNVKKGEEIEIVYPKGKLEKSRIYNCKNNFKLNYLLMLSGILIVISSIIVF